MSVKPAVVDEVAFCEVRVRFVDEVRNDPAWWPVTQILAEGERELQGEDWLSVCVFDQRRVVGTNLAAWVSIPEEDVGDRVAGLLTG